MERDKPTAAMRDLQQALVRAGYTESALLTATQPREANDRIDLPVALRRTADPSPFHTLVRLFFLYQVIEAEQVDAAIAPARVDALLDSGVLTRCADGLQAGGMLLPFQDLFFLSDFGPHITASAPRDDHVLSVGAASVTVANLTVRRQVEKVLDLGTGCGVQALLAARHSARVVGTDVNDRALWFAERNAQLNQVATAEWRRGNLYEPLAGESFDLIVANPPFVVSPEVQYVYRDGGKIGDRISEEVIRGAAARLSDGGFATVLFNWCHHDDDDWTERPSQWVAKSGCDAWLMRFDTSDELAYAANWLRPTEGLDRSAYAAGLGRWLSYYEKLGIRRFSAGAMVLRRRASTRNWTRADSIPSGRRHGGCSEQIERIFANQTILEDIGEGDALLDHSLVLDPAHELHHRLVCRQGTWTVDTATLRQTVGFELEGEVDRYVAAVLAACDGARPLGQVLRETAQRAQVSVDQLTVPAAFVMRQLLRLGFLEFHGPART